MNILIVKLSAIGDVVHTLPSLVALRRLYPEAHITWVVEEAAADLIKGHPLLDAVLVSHRKSWIKHLQEGRIRSTFREIMSFVKELRMRPYDLVIDFHGLFKSAVVVFLSRGKRKLGYRSMQELSGLFIHERIAEDMNKHAVDRYLDFPRYLGAKIQDVEFVLPQDPSAEEKIKALMQQHGLQENNFIAMSPIAYWETKLWDHDHFAHLADRIQQKLGMKVVWTGSGKKSLEEITSRMESETINLGGQTTLPELACLYKKANMLITTDSGPMHIAAAVGTPVIALFGPTDPKRTGPYGHGHKIIQAGVSCSPCFLKKCPTRKCMKDIGPSIVFAAVKENLAKEK